MAEFTDISQLGITKTAPKITVVPEEETILAKELTEGEGSNLIGGFMSGLQNADWANLGRIARANLSSNTLNKFSWFLNQPIKGDVAATEEVEEGWNYMSAQEQLGITDEQWDAMPTKERITKLKANAVKSTDEFFNVNPDSPAYVLGNVAGTLTTPTLAFTMAKPAAVATYAGADAALYGMGDTGEVDPVTVGISATIGYGGAAAVQKIASKISSKGKANHLLFLKHCL